MKAADAAHDMAGNFVWAGARTNYYDQSERKIRLTLKTAHSETIQDLCIACHEAAHAIQHRQKTKAWRLYLASDWLCVLWIADLCALIVSAMLHNWIAVGVFFVLMLLTGIVRGLAILNLERQAWRMSKAWMMENLPLLPKECREILRVSRSSISTYVRGLFFAR